MAVRRTGSNLGQQDGRIVSDEAFLYVPWTPTPAQDRRLIELAHIHSHPVIQLLHTVQAELAGLSPTDPRRQDPRLQAPFACTPWGNALLVEVNALLSPQPEVDGEEDEDEDEEEQR